MELATTTQNNGMQKAQPWRQLPSAVLTECNDLVEAYRSCEALSRELKGTTELVQVLEAPQISVLRKKDTGLVVDLVIMLITRLVDSQNTTIKMNAMQISDTAQDIVQDFWELRVEELVYIFKEARKKKTFNRLDQSVIYQWIDEYRSTDRIKAVEVARNAKQEANKEQSQQDAEEIRKWYAGVLNGEKQQTVNMLNDMRKQQEQEKRKKNIDIAKYEIFKAGYLESKGEAQS